MNNKNIHEKLKGNNHDKEDVTLMPLIASALFGAMNPRALSEIYMDLPQLCDTAEIIVFGEITDIEYTMDDASKTPRTLVSVKPITFIKDIRDESPQIFPFF